MREFPCVNYTAEVSLFVHNFLCITFDENTHSILSHINLGTGDGFSVREVIEHSWLVTNLRVPIIEGPQRAGDCAKLVSGSEAAKSELGWEPKRSTLSHMIGDAWRWHQVSGYDK